MSTTAIAATNAYRHKVALAAALGSAVSPIKYLAFSTSDATYDPATNTNVPGEFTRIQASVSVSGVTVKATATLKGTQVGSRVLRSVAALTADNTLVGRRVIAPKAFEPETDMDFELTFQY